MGIVLAYGAVSAILFAFAQQAHPAALPTPVLVASQTHASGD